MIHFIDFEASSLNEASFPIEVAWVDELGNAEGYLIKPSEGWLAGGRGWSFESERIHGISLATLLTDGYPIETVARRAAEVLSSETSIVVSDAPAFDGHWLGMLLTAGGIERTPALLHVHKLYGMLFRPLLAALLPGDEAARNHIGVWAAEVIRVAEGGAARQSATSHRALPDAERLRRTWLAVTAAVDNEIKERKS